MLDGWTFFPGFDLAKDLYHHCRLLLTTRQEYFCETAKRIKMVGRFSCTDVWRSIPPPPTKRRQLTCLTISSHVFGRLKRVNGHVFVWYLLCYKYVKAVRKKYLKTKRLCLIPTNFYQHRDLEGFK